MTSVPTSRESTALSEADVVLKRQGRSFYWARVLLKNEHADRATRLYSLCRYLDDLADETTSAAFSRAALHDVKLSIASRQANHPVIQDGILLIQECGIDPRVVCQLIDGVCSDLEPVAIVNLDDLLRYCYQVAGTVGLMMCNILGTKNSAALAHAVDLGVAMQLTNICRDVQADALAGRRYLPASMVGDLSPAALVNPSADIQPQLQECIRQLLGMAKRYYRSGEMGLSYLPVRARMGILTAARIYSQIGTCLARRQYRFWQGRVVVSPARKFVVTAKLLVEAPLSPSFWSPTRQHEPAMHHAFSAMLASDRSANLTHGN
jgi:phytoene synthase